MDIEQALLCTINIAVIAAVILFVGFEHVRGFVFRKASAFARIVYLLLALSNVVYGAERGKPFVPPPSLIAEPEPTIRIVVDQMPVSKSAACPMDASVLIDVIDGPNHFTGSGTCVESSAGRSLIITCAHTWRGCKNPSISVTHEKKTFPAKVLREDTRIDIALLEIQADLPTIEIASNQPPIETTITSVGASLNGQNLVEKEHRVSRILNDAKPPCFQTDGTLQWSGRSGGGAFHDGKLCGTVIGNRNDARESLYTTVGQIRAFLPVAAGGGQKRVIKAYSLESCVWCKYYKDLLGEGSADTRIDWTDEEIPQWIRRKLPRGYLAPVFVWQLDENRFQWPQSSQGITMAMLDEWAKDSIIDGSPAVSSGPVGATIQGRAFLEKAFGYLQDGAEYRLKWIRRGGKEALLMGKIPTREELIGTDGRFELSTTASGLPVHTVAFEYRFANDKVYLKFDEIECDLPEQNTVGSSQPVGSVILTVWTVFSVIQTIHAILTPTIDIWLGEEINATAKFEGGKLSVDCVPNPPSIRAHWSFWFGFLKFDYQRPLTGVVLGLEEVVAQFHQSRRLRDWAIPVE